MKRCKDLNFFVNMLFSEYNPIQNNREKNPTSSSQAIQNWGFSAKYAPPLKQSRSITWPSEVSKRTSLLFTNCFKLHNICETCIAPLVTHVLRTTCQNFVCPSSIVSLYFIEQSAECQWDALLLDVQIPLKKDVSLQKFPKDVTLRKIWTSKVKFTRGPMDRTYGHKCNM